MKCKNIKCDNDAETTWPFSNDYYCDQCEYEIEKQMDSEREDKLIKDKK